MDRSCRDELSTLPGSYLVLSGDDKTQAELSSGVPITMFFLKKKEAMAWLPN